MGNKTYTVLITTNSRGKTRKLTISAAWVKTLAFLSLVGMVVSGAIIMDYMSLLIREGENKRLKHENAILNQQVKIIQAKVDQLENTVERVRKFESKLRLITKIGEQTDVTHLAIGPIPKMGQAFTEFNEPLSTRGPASLSLKERGAEKAFLEKPPVDEKRGELVNFKLRSLASLSVQIDRVIKAAELREASVLALHELLSERQDRLNNIPNIKPIPHAWYSSYFGYRIDPFTGRPHMHKGLDLVAPYGTTVYAPADGIVSYVAYEPGYGKVVVIDHGYGVKTRYGHNSQIYVKVGQKVKRYDRISAVGSTGRSSGPHLHYEVRIHGIPVDPINYILDE